MPSAEQYLKPEVIRTIKRLDLRAQFIVKGYLQGFTPALSTASPSSSASTANTLPATIPRTSTG